MSFDCLQAYQEQRKGFFRFDNSRRNALLASKLDKGANSLSGLPPIKKTGTTICGLVTQDAVILGADTRATEDTIVADKNCSKLHRIAANIYCAGAGTAADLEHTTDWLASQVELKRLNMHTQPRVSSVVSTLSQELYKYQGYKGCAVVLGGVDATGPSLYKIHPHGSTDRSPFATMGSGSLNAMAVLEAGYKDSMTVDEGRTLVVQAIRTGIFNDLGSGGNVDICVITKDGAVHTRSFDSPNPRIYKMPQIAFPINTTPILKKEVTLLRQRIAVHDGDVEMTVA